MAAGLPSDDHEQALRLSAKGLILLPYGRLTMSVGISPRFMAVQSLLRFPWGLDIWIERGMVSLEMGVS